jgi:multisubunit Na+/H+ antiporter MnhB subunit
LIWHAFEGIAIFALSLIVLAFSIKAKPKSIRICAVLGLVYVVAGVGGLFFVLSAFTNNGNSAQMGGGFIGA